MFSQTQAEEDECEMEGCAVGEKALPPGPGPAALGASKGNIEPLDHKPVVISGLAASGLHNPRAFAVR